MMNHIRIASLFIAMMLSLGSSLPAQIVSRDSAVTLSGLVESYVAWDVDGPATNARPSFLYNHSRTKEITVNLALLRAQYADESTRASFGVMTGTYAEANLAAEPSAWRNVYEAVVGARVSTSSNLWLDAGLFGSHIGFESAIGKDNWTLTRSILAENSPYYECGAKFSFTTADNAWTLCALVLNGWQQIQRPSGQSDLCWGSQINFQPTKTLQINSSTFVGNTKPDSARQMRYFENLYGIFSISPSFSFIIGLDAGLEQKPVGLSGANTWASVVLIGRFIASEHLRLAARVEQYRDPGQVIIATGTSDGIDLLGCSLNVDYDLHSHALLRTEVRLLSNSHPLFTKKTGNPGDENISIVSSLTVSF